MIGAIHHNNKTLIVTPEEEAHYNKLSTGLEKSRFVKGIWLKRMQKIMEAK